MHVGFKVIIMRTTLQNIIDLFIFLIQGIGLKQKGYEEDCLTTADHGGEETEAAYG